MHEAGYSYNDVKLDNFLIGSYPFQQSRMPCRIRLIDFGFANAYLDEHGIHIQQVKKRLFQGNLLFSSCDSMCMLNTSRRDDLISLCYMMLFLQKGKLPFIETNHNMTSDEEFIHIRAKKKSLRPTDLCISKESESLLKFMTEIFALKFEEAPYYDKLRFMLATELTEFNQQPYPDIFGRCFEEQKFHMRHDLEYSEDVEECP